MPVSEKHKGGRPPAPPNLKRVNVPVRLPRDLVDWIDAQDGTRSALIEEAVLLLQRKRARVSAASSSPASSPVPV
jgi:hypothetical protein